MEVIKTIKQGFKYATIFFVISGIMGAVYGLFGNLYYGPAMFSISVIGIFSILNLPFVLIALVINLILLLFKKHSPIVFVYTIYSFSFLVIFLSFFFVFKQLDLHPF